MTVALRNGNGATKDFNSSLRNDVCPRQNAAQLACELEIDDVIEGVGAQLEIVGGQDDGVVAAS